MASLNYEASQPPYIHSCSAIYMYKLKPFLERRRGVEAAAPVLDHELAPATRRGGSGVYSLI